MTQDETPARERWARFRFSIIGPLLAAPPAPGALAGKLAELAAVPYRHPWTGEVVAVSQKTIERWYYRARAAADPVAALARQVHAQAGTHPSMPARAAAALERQYREHPRWTAQLHHDNLVALAREDPALGRIPSYTTVRRFMKQSGWVRDPKKRRRKGQPAPTPRETRSYQVTHVHGLWHLDFHEGSRRVLTEAGEYERAFLLGILDDRSRLGCHEVFGQPARPRAAGGKKR